MRVVADHCLFVCWLVGLYVVCVLFVVCCTLLFVAGWWRAADVGCLLLVVC